MSQSNALPTAWIWQAGMDTRGLTLNREKGVLEYTFQIGCFCGGPDLTQSMADFMARGVAPAAGILPADIAAEVAKAVADLQSHSSSGGTGP